MPRKLKDRAIAKQVKGPPKVKRSRVAAADLYSEAALCRFADKGPSGIDWYLVDWPRAMSLPGLTGEWYAGRFATLYSSPIHTHDADLIVGRVLRTLRPDITFSAGRRKVCHAIARWALLASARWWTREEEASKRQNVKAKCVAWAAITARIVESEAVLDLLFVLRHSLAAEDRRVPAKMVPAKTKRTRNLCVSA